MKCLNWGLEIVLQCIISAVCIQSEISNIVIPVKTDFSCLNKTAGFYADSGAACKVYHTCDEYGNKFTYHCPEETAFRQDALICDHAHLVRCHEHTIYNSKYIEEERNKNSSLKVTAINDSGERSQNVFHATQLPKPINQMRYGFTISTKKFSENFNSPNVAEHNITNFLLKNDASLTTSLPINNFMKTTLQHVSPVNNTRESASIKNDNTFMQKQVFNSRDKLSERINQKDHLNRKTNDAFYNFMKLPPIVFLGNTQNQNREDSVNNYQNIKNITHLPTLAFTNHGNYPYLETLKSIQKNTEIPTTTSTIRTEHTSVITTELPVHVLTLSLKPLTPRELEDDPYYPKLSTSTELYYTLESSKEWSYSKHSTEATWTISHFELPSVLPDLNSLEDIVDRRKLFYIPRINSN